jgi:hypothetical protein
LVTQRANLDGIGLDPDGMAGATTVPAWLLPREHGDPEGRFVIECGRRLRV